VSFQEGEKEGGGEREGERRYAHALLFKVAEIHRDEGHDLVEFLFGIFTSNLSFPSYRYRGTFMINHFTSDVDAVGLTGVIVGVDAPALLSKISARRIRASPIYSPD